MSAFICPSALLGGVCFGKYFIFSKVIDGYFQITRRYKRDIRQRLYGSAVFGRGVSRSDDVLEVIMSSRIFAAEGVTAIFC